MQKKSMSAGSDEVQWYGDRDGRGTISESVKSLNL